MKAVLLTLGTYLDNQTGKCIVSYNRIAQGASVSRETAVRCIRQAKGEGWLSVQRKRRKGAAWDVNHYQVRIPKGSDDRSLGSDERSQGSDENTPDLVTRDHTDSVRTLINSGAEAGDFENPAPPVGEYSPAILHEFQNLTERHKELIASWIGNGFPPERVSVLTYANLPEEKRQELHTRPDAREDVA
jgi:hypothetical protein